MTAPSPVPPARRFRELLARPGLIRSLGAHDVLSALIMEQAGLEMIFLGGFGASASLLGLPDLNLITQTEMAEAVRRTTARVTIPVIADADTGHGGALNVARTVELFEAAGAAGLLLEDQVAPKRCGHFADKQVVPRAEFLARIRAAVQARRHPDFTLFARTDARATHGLDEAIDRMNAAADAGADVAFVEAPRSREELAAIPRRVRLPVLANMLTGGVTPILSCDELAALGYKLAVAPVESLEVCARALRDLCAAWQTGGRVDALAAQAMPFAELKDLLGVDRYLARDRNAS
ncbi:MAG: 2,3-dimethylmalate lyase [Verrucomicrobiota bacterium]